MTTNPDHYYLYQCCYCLEIADGAVVTLCCTKILCSLHYQKLRQGRCPYCRQENFEAQPQNFVRKMIQKMSTNIQVQIKSIGVSYVLTLKEQDLITTLKQRIFEKQQIPKQNYYLVYGGRTLYDQNTLGQAGIKNRGAIYLLARQVGG